MLQASVIVLESLSLHWASKHVSPRGFNCWFSFTWNWSSKPRRRACGGSWSSCAWVLISRRTISCIYPTTSSQSHVSWWKVAGFCQGFAVPRHFDFAPSLLIPSTSIWAEMKGVASCRCPGAGPALENLLNHYEQQGVLSQIQQKCLEVVWADGGIGVALGEVDLFWYDLVSGTRNLPVNGCLHFGPWFDHDWSNGMPGASWTICWGKGTTSNNCRALPFSPCWGRSGTFFVLFFCSFCFFGFPLSN